MKNKIVLCSNTSWYIYNFRAGLIRTILEKGYEVIIIAPKDDYSKRLELLGGRYYDINIDNKGTNPISDIKLIYDYYKLYKQIEPEVILTYTIKPNIYGSLASKILKIPTINVVSGLGTVFLNNNFASKIAKLLYKIALSKNQVVFENKDDANEFVKGKLIKEKQVKITAGSGINTDRFQPKKTRKTKNQKKDINFLLIARLIRDKGIFEYIEAIKLLRPKYSNMKFKLLGSYYEGNPSAISEDEVEGWIKDGIVDYLGYTDFVIEEIEKVDCVVLPSYREGLSRVLLEAGSMSKPIITTNVAGCKDVVDDGVNGYLVPPKNSLALANAMEKMANLSEQARINMGKKGRKKVIKEFGEKGVIDEYLTMIDKEIANSLPYDKVVRYA